MKHGRLPSMMILASCGWVQSRTAPVIDLKQWRTGGSGARHHIAEQVAEAYQEHGFFYVRNHGVEKDVSGAADDAMRQFFDLPRQDKFQVEADKSRALKTA